MFSVDQCGESLEKNLNNESKNSDDKMGIFFVCKKQHIQIVIESLILFFFSILLSSGNFDVHNSVIS